MEFTIPVTLKKEHEELHQMLQAATQLKGTTGEAAKNVARLMHPHFIKEEEYALPPLSLLPLLAQGNFSTEMEPALQLTNKLKQELPTMLAEHKQIVMALNDLIKAAQTEQHKEVEAFAEKLIQHAKTEEEVSYPAALLVGEFLKAKLAAAANENNAPPVYASLTEAGL